MAVSCPMPVMETEAPCVALINDFVALYSVVGALPDSFSSSAPPLTMITGVRSPLGRRKGTAALDSSSACGSRALPAPYDPKLVHLGMVTESAVAIR